MGLMIQLVSVAAPGFFFFLCLFRAKPAAYGGSQARGQIGAGAVRLPYSHSNARSKLHPRHSLCQRWIISPLIGATDRTQILMDTSQVLNLLSHNRNSQRCQFYLQPSAVD